MARLDSYFDPNERKYYITPQSVEAVIQEEIQRAGKNGDLSPSEVFGSDVTRVKHPGNATVADERKLQELERQIMDLKIANRGKDYLTSSLRSTGRWDNWRQNSISWMGRNCDGIPSGL